MKKLLILTFTLLIFLSSCYDPGRRVKGNGNIQTQEKQVSPFDEVEVHGAIDVLVSQGDLQPIKIEGDGNLLRLIEIDQRGDRLIIRKRQGYNLLPTRKMKIYLSSPSFKVINAHGACDIIGQTKIANRDNLDLDVSGAGSIRMEVDAPKVNAGISGAGLVNLKGQTKDFELGLSGAGKARCYELLSENTQVRISGAANAEVYASMKLDVDVSGAGNVKYKGEATDINKNISGAGSVKKAGEE